MKRGAGTSQLICMCDLADLGSDQAKMIDT